MAMSDINVAVRYGTALFQVIDQKEADKVSTDLFSISEIFSDPEINKFITHPKTTNEMTTKLIKTLKLGLPLEPFLLLVFKKNRENLLPFIAQEFKNLVNTNNNLAQATVISAIPLTDQTLAEIKKRLDTLTNKQVSIETLVNPDIWGGLRIELEGKVIDLTLLNSFNQLKRNLVVN